MKQGNGSDVLGTSDPQSADIGIVYVSPNDDRKTILAGILTQEKLGRKRIAVVLLAQNKAFQPPVDFDDLKSLRRKLRAQLVFIAPGGSTAAELARRCRFIVYSSLDNFASALRNEDPSVELKRSNGVRGLFGSAKYKAALGPGNSASRNTPHKSVGNGRPEPQSDGLSHARRTSQSLAARDEEEREERRGLSPALAGGALAGAALFGSEAMAHHDLSHHDAGGILPGGDSEENVDGVDAMSFPGAYDEPEDEPHREEDEALPPAVPVSTPVPSEPPSRGSGSQPSRPGTDPSPIELGPTRKRNSAKLPPADDVSTLPDTNPERRRSRGRGAGVAGASAAAGAAALARQSSAGGPPPPTMMRGSGGGGRPRGSVAGGKPPDGRRRVIIAAILLAITLLIVGGTMLSLAYADPNVLGPLQNILPRGGAPASVTITPDSKPISNTYIILAVPNGKSNTNQRQIGARTLSLQQSASKLITGTGHNQVAATPARGRLVFTNGSVFSYTVGAGTSFRAANGASFAIDAPANIPAADPGVAFGVTSVPAHAATPGTGGNIGPLAINNTCCSSSGNVTVRNDNAFTGGQDAKNYNFVRQGDVDAFVNNTTQQLTNQANSALHNQLKPGEQLAEATDCPSTVTHDNPIGDQGQNVPSTTVTISVSCKAVAYDQNGMRDQVSQLLQKKAADDAGPGYSLQGNIVIRSQVQQVNEDNTVSLLVSANGVWVYQFSNQQKQQLARLIAGKSIDSAKTLLQSQTGVQHVTISSNSATLPSDPGQIAIVVQNVPGAQENGTPTAPPSSVATTPPNNNPGTSSSQPGRGDVLSGSQAMRVFFARLRRTAW